MSIFANPRHRISRTGPPSGSLRSIACKQTRAAREANVGEDELAEAFDTIERLTEEHWQGAMIALTFAGMTLKAFFYATPLTLLATNTSRIISTS